MELKKFVDFDQIDIAFKAKSDKALKKRHFIFSTMKWPWLVSVGTSLTKFSLSAGLPVKGLVKSTIFDIFCGGESLETCSDACNELEHYGIGAIFDYSVEGEKTETGFDATAEEVLRTIETASKSDVMKFAAFKITGVGAFDLLAKIHAGETLFTEESSAYDRIVKRVERICALASELDVTVLIDAEETWIQKPIDDITIDMMRKYNKEKAVIYYTFQMYCHAMLDNLQSLHKQAVSDGYILGAKLVRGAYMEKERERAEEMGYLDPIQPTKQSTDDDFNAACQYCIEHLNEIGLFAGSHNEESNYRLTLLMDEHNLQPDDQRVYFGQLYGMSDHISFNLAHGNYNVIKYVPYGPLKATIPYLIRRAAENTSVKGQSGRELTLVTKELKRRKS
ncbi:proline dehydrogenase family protein [Roseivirga misakiensis]|uniref:Proline dehydrogenase n=1 Tax=Roseivirga misakiensis TaxID=1563681 RepID=A0A1E5SKG5_9BACT|nr:proline dehydrogenase family protein [Roseivirga misakiensis]OEJ99618.1 proline dehydrogenase [Roseivirga misakiensis]